MTPPCANCHRTDFLGPVLPATDNKQTQKVGKDSHPTPASVCPAESHWPDWLRGNYPDLNQLTWWVRSNFEETKKSWRTDQGKDNLPFRIRIGHADLKIKLKPENIHIEIPKDLKIANSIPIDINSGPLGEIDGRLKIRCNRIPLQMQSLLTFVDLDVDAPLADGAPERISVGDFGQLHFIARPDDTFAGIMNFLTPFGVPRPLPGRDWPPNPGSGPPLNFSDRCLSEAEVMAGVDQCLPPEETYDKLCADPFVYDAVVRKTGRADWNLTPLVPVELFDSQVRLPNYFELEDLIGRLMKLAARLGSQKKKSPPSVKLEQILTFLRPGSSLTLDLQDIQDFFLPGILDLGPSRTKVKITLGSDRTFWGEIPTVDLVLDPMDYPADNIDKRPPIHLENARIFAGTPKTNRLGETVAPGIRFNFDPKDKILSLEGNLDLSAQLTLPPLGSYSLEAGVLFDLALQWKPDGIKIVPGRTHIEIQKIDLSNLNKTDSVLSDTDLILTDQPRFTDPVVALLGPAMNPTIIDSSEFHFEVGGHYQNNGPFLVASRFKIPVDEFGDFEGKKFIADLDIPLEIQVSGKEKNWASSLRLNSYLMENLDPEDWHHYGYRLASDIHTVDPTTLENNPVLEGGVLRWEVKRNGRLDDILQVRLDARAIHHPKLLLKDVNAALQLERGNFSEEVTKISVPQFKFSANPAGAERGVLRGPFLIEQTGNVVLEIHWDKPHRRLEVENINILLKAHQLDVLKPKVRKLLPPGVRFVGLDGGLQGNFKMNFTKDPKNWNGKGHLTLRGTREGDLYWMGPGGNRVGPPIFRDTRWNLYRINRINRSRAYALGWFRLNTVFNPKALFFAKPEKLNSQVQGGYGVGGRPLRPYELEWEMRHDNMPWSLEGYINRSNDYIQTLCYEDPDCAPKVTAERSRP